MRILVFSLSILLWFAPVSANAVEPIDFNGKIRESSSLSLGNFLQKNMAFPLSSYQIAPVDLNGDGLEEFILHEESCAVSGNDCIFKILSENNDTILLLGEIEGRSVMLGNTTSQGVRDILTVKNGANDYDYTVYVWEPAQSKYIIGGKTP